MTRILLLLSFITLLMSCKKDELVNVENNKAPNDNTIEDVTYENYVNRTYILALGREPDSVELNSALSVLKASELDSAAREQFLALVFNNSDYLAHEYELNKINLLNDLDTQEITNYILIFESQLADTVNQAYWPVLIFQRDRLVSLRNAFGEFTSGTISEAELQRRMCYNYFYEQINMGASNYVNYTFQNLLKRNPTTAELANGILMVNGGNASLFLQAGSSMTDFLNILTGSASYYEGQILYAYDRYLHRTATTIEMNTATQLFLSTNDYVKVQKSILSSNEFIGI